MTLQTARLTMLMGEVEVGLGDVVLIEVLQGCKTDRDFVNVLNFLKPLPVIRVADEAIAIDAARNYRRLRALGFTVRSTIDSLIATRCIEDDIPLLHSDRDFDPFVRHLGLRDAMLEAA